MSYVLLFIIIIIIFNYLLPKLRQIAHIVGCASVARYHPLVGLCITVGTLTSKQLNSHSFIIPPHMDGANLFTLVSNIKVSPHQNEFTFEGDDTKLITNMFLKSP